ncbi:MAG: HU family DNA-binding protein [Candidatus Izemoplasma sp.]
MDYKNKMFRRLSIIFLVMAMISLMLFIILMFLIAKDEAFTCPEDQFFCYIPAEYPLYITAIYGLSFSLVLMLLLSSLFSKQVEFVSEYSGYTRSVSESEREKIYEKSKSSAALKEYFLHLEEIERKKLNKENQLSMSDITGEEFIQLDNIDLIKESTDEFNIEENIVETYQSKQVEEMISLEEIEQQQETLERINIPIIPIVIAEPIIVIREDEPKIIKVAPVKIIKKINVPRKTKKDIEKIIYESTDLNKTKSKLFLKTLLEVITEEIKQGNIINISDFGKFRKNTYKSRNAINPQTKEKIIIEEHSVARFYPNKKFVSILLTNKITTNSKSNTDIKLVSVKNITQDIVIKDVVKPIKRQTLTKSNNKKEIILMISTKSGLSKNKSKEFLNAFIEIITFEMKAKNIVFIHKFGKFTTIDKAPRKAINPYTKEKIIIQAHTSVKFKFAQDFKRKLNQKK